MLISNSTRNRAELSKRIKRERRNVETFYLRPLFLKSSNRISNLMEKDSIARELVE